MSTRYILTLRLEMENAAFEENRAIEASRILHNVAAQLDYGACSGDASTTGEKLKAGEPVTGWIRDSNGNTCGTWEAKPRRERR